MKATVERIDTDVPKYRRAELIDYIADKYGHDKVFQLQTFTYLGLKSGLKAIQRALDDKYGTYPFDDVNKLTKKLPDNIDGKAVTLELYDEIVNKKPDEWKITLGDANYTKAVNQWAKVQDFFGKYPLVHDLMQGVTGCISAVGVHAGAIIVSGRPLASYVPLCKSSGAAVLPVVGYDMSGATTLNLLKIDLLGLRTLSTMEKFIELTNIGDDWFDSENFNDSAVYDTINKGFTTDGFQICSNAAKTLLRKFSINTFEDLVAFNAGNRPGPLSKDKDTGVCMMDIYLQAKETGNIVKIHPDIDNILKETYGCIWYQEHCLSISQKLAGYNLGNADKRIRKTLGKKKVAMIPELKAEFVYGKQYDYDKGEMTNTPSPYCEGAVNRGYPEDVAIKIFDSMAEFAKYSSTNNNPCALY